MKCGRIRKLLSDHTDEALPAAQSAEVESHLAVCPDCAKERDRLAQIVGKISDLGGGTAPWDFWPSVQKRLQIAALKPACRFTNWRLMYRPVAAVSALGALVAVVVITLSAMIGGSVSPNLKADAKLYAEYVRAYSQYRSQQAFADVDALMAAAELADGATRQEAKE